jgi:hypothetical protein
VLSAFYFKHSPDKVPTVEATINKYLVPDNRLSELSVLLKTKYGEAPEELSYLRAFQLRPTAGYLNDTHGIDQQALPSVEEACKKCAVDLAGMM